MAGNTNTTPSKKRVRRRNRNRKAKSPGVSKPVSAPVAKSVKTRNVAPIFRQTREGCTITHREYITDITATGSAFLISVFNINSGLVSSFPWLAQVASRFESYTFERLNYIYEPMVPTSTPGSLMMAIDFDASDSAPTNKVTLMSYAGAARTSVFDTVRLLSTNIDRKKMVHERYVRSGALSPSSDIKTFDVGNLYVATVGAPANVTTALGELYVEYTVRLRTPQIQTAPNLSLSGRRAAQQGTISFGQDGKITSHVAEITGEGNQPLLSASPGESVIRIDPRIKRCLMTVASTPTTGNWGNAFSTCFTNLTSNKLAPDLEVALVGNGASSTQQRQLYGASSPAAFTSVSSVSTTPRPLVEQWILSETDDEQRDMNSKPWGQMINDVIVGIRDNLHSTGIQSKYSLLPLDTDTWPKINAAWQALNNANSAFNSFDKVDAIMNKVVDWPTILNAIPARSNVLPDGQVFTFNNKVDMSSQVKPTK